MPLGMRVRDREPIGGLASLQETSGAERTYEGAAQAQVLRKALRDAPPRRVAEPLEDSARVSLCLRLHRLAWSITSLPTAGETILGGRKGSVKRPQGVGRRGAGGGFATVNEIAVTTYKRGDWLPRSPSTAIRHEVVQPNPPGAGW